MKRVFALTVFVPIGVGAYELARRIGAVPSGIGGPHEVGAPGPCTSRIDRVIGHASTSGRAPDE